MRRLLLTGILLSLVAGSAVAQKRACLSDLGCPIGKICVGDETSSRCETLKCDGNGDKPVCGLNGSTYANACEATRVHIGIAYRSPCGRCGGATDHTCSATDFCDIDEGVCGMRGGGGWCVTVPPKCARGGEPVCGCDGKTYGSECLRQLARVPQLHRGACGAVANLPAMDFLPWTHDLPPADLPDAAPAPLETPTLPKPVLPEAGSGSGVATPPADDAAPKATAEGKDPSGLVCQSDDKCKEGEFCERPVGQCSAEGRCKKRPLTCLKPNTDPEKEWELGRQGWEPVCGCDDLTYTDECWARLNGQSLRCKGKPCGSCTTPGTQPAPSGGG